jgi:hypothetical protein
LAIVDSHLAALIAGSNVGLRFLLGHGLCSV